MYEKRAFALILFSSREAGWQIIEQGCAPPGLLALASWQGILLFFLILYRAIDFQGEVKCRVGERMAIPCPTRATPGATPLRCTEDSPR